MVDAALQACTPSPAAGGPLGADDERDDTEDVPCGMLFATETMAELSARQGRLADAVAIYRHLVLGQETETPAQDPSRLDRVARWKVRLFELEVKAAAGGDQGSKDASSRASGHATTRADSQARPSPTQTADRSTSEHPAVDVGGSDGGVTSPPPSAAFPPATSPLRTALVISGPVRSGQLIYAEGRDLIVLASVHSGAQVLADGHIHVYGALNGRAIAGARGARDAQVFCLTLAAELVGVDTGYLLSENIPAAAWGTPARIYLSPAGSCVVEPLTVGNGRGSAELRQGRRFLW